MSTPASDIIADAEKELGKPYVYGAAGPNQFDCSGLVRFVFLKHGISLPHKASIQATKGKSVSTSDIQPGDLVFSNWGDGTNSHVGIAVSSTRIIAAPHAGAPVRYATLNSTYLAHVTAVRRITGITQGTKSTTTTAGGTSTTTRPRPTTGATTSRPRPTGGGSSSGGGTVTGGGSSTGGNTANGGTGSDSDSIWDKVSDAIDDLAKPFTSLSTWSDNLLAGFLIPTFIRVICGIVGIGFVLYGSVLLSREATD
jgi:hypothetical protein